MHLFIMLCKCSKALDAKEIYTTYVRFSIRLRGNTFFFACPEYGELLPICYDFTDFNTDFRIFV